MNTKHFEHIMNGWRDMVNQTMDLFDEGQQKFLDASSNLFESMKFFSEMTGNIPLSDIYKTLSKNLTDIKNRMNEK